MPKLSLSKRNEIFRLLTEGYLNKEVAEKTGVSPSIVSKFKKEMKTKDERGELQGGQILDESSTLISKSSMKKLYDLQGMFGLESLDSVVDKVWREIIAIMKEKYDFSPEFRKTPSEVFIHFKKRTMEAEKLDDDYLHAIYRDNAMYQFKMNFEFKGSYVEFIKKLAMLYVKEHKWSPSKIFTGNPFIKPEDRAKWEQSLKDGTEFILN
jgi:hypothetical protein